MAAMPNGRKNSLKPGAAAVRRGKTRLRGAAQIAVVRRGGANERLRGGDAMFLQHHHEHLGVDDRAGVKQFHAGI